MMVEKALSAGTVAAELFSTAEGFVSVTVIAVSLPTSSVITCNTTDLGPPSSLKPLSVFLVTQLGGGQPAPPAKSYYFSNAAQPVAEGPSTLSSRATRRYTLMGAANYPKIDVVGGLPTLGEMKPLSAQAVICVNKADVVITQGESSTTYMLTANSVFLLASSDPAVDGAYFTDQEIPLGMLSDDWEEPNG